MRKIIHLQDGQIIAVEGSLADSLCIELSTAPIVKEETVGEVPDDEWREVMEGRKKFDRAKYTKRRVLKKKTRK